MDTSFFQVTYFLTESSYRSQHLVEGWDKFSGTLLNTFLDYSLCILVSLAFECPATKKRARGGTCHMLPEAAENRLLSSEIQENQGWTHRDRFLADRPRGPLSYSFVPFFVRQAFHLRLADHSETGKEASQRATTSFEVSFAHGTASWYYRDTYVYRRGRRSGRTNGDKEGSMWRSQWNNDKRQSSVLYIRGRINRIIPRLSLCRVWSRRGSPGELKPIIAGQFRTKRIFGMLQISPRAALIISSDALIKWYTRGNWKVDRFVSTCMLKQDIPR